MPSFLVSGYTAAMQVHFTITGYGVSFKEEVPDNLNRAQIVAELNKRIDEVGGFTFNGQPSRVREVFFIDHTRPVDQRP